VKNANAVDLDLIPEENVRVQVDRGPGRILGHPVPVVDVVGHVLSPTLVKQLLVGGVGTLTNKSQNVNNNLT
jgi:hypothetical protein